MKDLKKRLTNRGTLIALGSQILIIVGVVYLMMTGNELSEGLVTNLTILGGAVLVVLTVLGIVNNPKEGKGFEDEDKNKFK